MSENRASKHGSFDWIWATIGGLACLAAMLGITLLTRGPTSRDVDKVSAPAFVLPAPQGPSNVAYAPPGPKTNPPPNQRTSTRPSDTVEKLVLKTMSECLARHEVDRAVAIADGLETGLGDSLKAGIVRVVLRSSPPNETESVLREAWSLARPVAPAERLGQESPSKAMIPIPQNFVVPAATSAALERGSGVVPATLLTAATMPRAIERSETAWNQESNPVDKNMLAQANKVAVRIRWPEYRAISLLEIREAAVASNNWDEATRRKWESAAVDAIGESIEVKYEPRFGDRMGIADREEIVEELADSDLRLRVGGDSAFERRKKLAQAAEEKTAAYFKEFERRSDSEREKPNHDKSGKKVDERMFANELVQAALLKSRRMRESQISSAHATTEEFTKKVAEVALPPIVSGFGFILAGFFKPWFDAKPKRAKAKPRTNKTEEHPAENEAEHSSK